MALAVDGLAIDLDISSTPCAGHPATIDVGLCAISYRYASQSAAHDRATALQY
jgi:hypothetical protein